MSLESTKFDANVQELSELSDNDLHDWFIECSFFIPALIRQGKIAQARLLTEKFIAVSKDLRRRNSCS